MSWFVFALFATLGWGCADLFYKRGSDSEDRFSHLKIAVWVGLVMGACSLIGLAVTPSVITPESLLTNIARYAPASLCYIVSMVVGYAGLRYLELSIISPIQNASGALSTVCMLIFFLATGRIRGVGDAFSTLDVIGTALIVAGVVALAIVEQRLSRGEKIRREYRYGALALLFPLLYCAFDTAGTAFDGVLLDESVGLGLSETDVLILYGFTFLLAGVAAWIFLWVKNGTPYNPFACSERPKAIAACCEEIGQIFYVYAMSARPMLAAPMIASYCIVSVLLSRVFLKERLRVGQNVCVAVVIAGIVLLGISEGLSEA